MHEVHTLAKCFASNFPNMRRSQGTSSKRPAASVKTPGVMSKSPPPAEAPRRELRRGLPAGGEVALKTLEYPASPVP